MYRKAKNEAGFTLLEVTCAIVILTVGLMGVAAMQTKAIQGNAFANSFSQGTNFAQEWMEWMINYINQPDQQYLLFQDKLQKSGFVRISLLDADREDDHATEIDMPLETETLLAFLAEKGIQDAAGTAFTVEQIPLAPAKGYRMVWRILANKPMENTTTVEIMTIVTNAFAISKRNTIRFILSSNL